MGRSPLSGLHLDRQKLHAPIAHLRHVEPPELSEKGDMASLPDASLSCQGQGMGASYHTGT